MIKLIYFFLLLSFPAYGQNTYEVAYSILKEGLEDEHEISFKDAVFTTETAFRELMPKSEWDENIEILKQLVTLHGLSNNKLAYHESDKRKIEIYASLFHVLTDTTVIYKTDKKFLHLPYVYDFEDIFGTRDWSNVFVSKLLQTKSGNCRSLPYLYKIICEELSVPCHLALAPNHIYIKHQAKKGGWYNTELTSATFPMDAWLMASGYISLESVQKGIYLDTLSEKESIALCVIDLAQGYNHKYPDNDGTFVIECCDLAMKHFPDYVNAILLKAETRLKQLQTMQKQYGYAYLKEVTNLQEGKKLWDEMNSLYMQLYQLGYRQMPEQMYVEWLTSLKTEKEKYTNKQVEQMNKN